MHNFAPPLPKKKKTKIKIKFYYVNLINVRGSDNDDVFDSQFESRSAICSRG